MSREKENKEKSLSLKGIKYWENLKTDPNYEFLFKKYKPWTLHTAYKRLFTNSTFEEVESLLLNNPKESLHSLTKKFQPKLIKKTFETKEEKKFIGRKRNKINSNISKSNTNNYLNYFKDVSFFSSFADFIPNIKSYNLNYNTRPNNLSDIYDNISNNKSNQIKSLFFLLF